MFDYKKYDFSMEGEFRGELFNKMKKKFEKSQSQNKVIELSDDELNVVSAASNVYEKKQCPFENIRCEDCEHYIKFGATKTCRQRYIKI
ncbi:MAG: hypothetical protein ACERKN_16170 [Velocimicrobium sp.]